jgi:hypothetical protein
MANDIYSQFRHHRRQKVIFHAFFSTSKENLVEIPSKGNLVEIPVEIPGVIFSTAQLHASCCFIKKHRGRQKDY